MGPRICVTISLLLVVFLSGCKAPPRRTRRTVSPTPPVDSPPSRSSPPTSYTVYNVRRGDTLYSLASRYGVSVQTLLRENSHIDDPTDIEVGTILLVPDREGVEPPPEPREYSDTPLANSESSGGSPRTVSNQSLHKGNPGARFWWPTAGRPTRRYGQKVRGFSEPGIGIEAPAGTKVCASADGTVIVRVDERGSPHAGWANVVAIRHAGGYVSWYGLLGNVSVREWQKVRKGTKIGTVGVRGELAYRLYRKERPVDPRRYLP